jgi:putative oxidoreductase
MPGSLQGVLSAAARVLIGLIFLTSAVGNKIPNFESVSSYMASEGVPAPKVLLAGAIAFLVVGSLSVMAGAWTRIGAAVLLVFLVAATYYFHDFWTFEGQHRQMQTIQFMKNLSLMGAMLFLIANGPGALSVDARLESREPESYLVQH